MISIIGKFLESIVRDALLIHFNRHSLLSESQHGFVPKRSCTSQLLTVLEDWTRAIQDNTYSDVIYLDFSKAFDTVPHKQLLHKLQAYGVRGNILLSFLTNHSQRVAINNIFFLIGNSLLVVYCKALAVLGPLLFAIYINDMPSIVSGSLFKFADDTKLYRAISNSSDLYKMTWWICYVKWSTDWLLSFNISKCKTTGLPLTVILTL